MNLSAQEKERLADAKRAFAKRNYDACILTLNEFAERGDMASAAALGEIYFRGGGGVARDYLKAKMWLEKVDGFTFSPPTIYKLGLMYYKGLGVGVDYNRAYEFFRRLALKRLPRGLVMVGLMHKNHEGVLFKPRLAQICFRSALKSRKLNFIENFSVKLMMLVNYFNFVRRGRLYKA